MGFLCSHYAWQVGMKRFSTLRPPYVTGSVLAHSDSHLISLSVPFFFFFSPFHSDSRLPSHCSRRLVRTALPDKTWGKLSLGFIPIHLATRGLLKKKYLPTVCRANIELTNKWDWIMNKRQAQVKWMKNKNLVNQFGLAFLIKLQEITFFFFFLKGSKLQQHTWQYLR